LIVGSIIGAPRRRKHQDRAPSAWNRDGKVILRAARRCQELDVGFVDERQRGLIVVAQAAGGNERDERDGR
jgi:hypothetical protein